MNKTFLEYVNNLVVNIKKVESFADYVRRVRSEKGLSLSDVQRNSRGMIDGSYVSRIENGYVLPQNITAKKLVALAEGLQIPVKELAAVASGELGEFDEIKKEESQLLNYFRELPRECKLDVLAMIEAIWHRNKHSDRREPELLPIVTVYTESTKRSGKKRA